MRALPAIAVVVAGLALTVALAGCGLDGVLPGAGSPGLNSPAEGAATTDGPGPEVALLAVYELEGDGREVIFLRADGLTDAEFDRVARSLADTLGVDVLSAQAASKFDPDLPALTPIDPETGTIGVTLTFHGFTPDEAGEYEARVTFARNGLDGGDLLVVVSRGNDEWEVVDIFEGPQA